MADFYVIYGEERYDFDVLTEAVAKARALGPEAVLHTTGTTMLGEYVAFQGVTTIMEAGCRFKQVTPGMSNGSCASTDVTINGGTVGNYLFASGYQKDVSKVVVTGLSKLTINSGAATYVAAVQGGICHDVLLTINGGTFNTIGSFANGNGNTIDGDYTINFNGGTTQYLFLASSAGAATGTITGKIIFNMTGGIVTKAFMTHRITTTATSASVVYGGYYVNLTGGTVIPHIYGTGNGTGRIEGGVHITIDGLIAPTVWVYGSASATTDLVEMKLKSGAIRMFNGGSSSANQEYNVNLTVEGGVIGWVVGGSYQNYKITGNTNVLVSGGTVTDALLGAGNGTGSHLAGNANVTITDGLITANVYAGGSGTMTGDATVTISGGTFAGYLAAIGSTTYASIDGNVTYNISGGVFTNAERAFYCAGIGGDGEGAGITGTVDVNITGGSFCGSIYLAGGTTYTQDDLTLDIVNANVDGSIYAGAAANGYAEGLRTVTLNGITVGGVLCGMGVDNTFEAAEGSLSSLNIGALGVTVAGAVSDFDSISLAAGATIAAGSVTAAAIKAEAAGADGAYKLATGFAAQASTITVTTNGSAIGSVTLSESVTTGSFTAGGDTYNVGLSGTDLYLCKNTDIPGPGPVPPTPTSTVAEVILTITDTAHEFKGATGGWKVQNDQTVAWQDITTLGEGYAILGLGATAADKAMPDIYVYNADAKYIAAYVTDAEGAVASFDSIFLGEAAMIQVGLADFNADGVSDLLLRTADGFVGYYAAGTFHEVQGLGLEWNVAALGDVDGNGRADVIIAHEAGYVGAYLIGTDGSITWADLGNLDSSTAIVGAGDVNGDGTDDVIVQVGANYFGAWTCTAGAVTDFFGIGEFDATVQDIADYNADGTDDLLFRTADGVVGAALITGADATTWAEYGALGAEWSTKGVGIL